MKNKLFLLAAVLLAATAVSAQTVNSRAKAEIVAPVTIVDNSGLAGGTALDFGVLTISPTVGGYCELSTTNSRTANGGVTVVNSSTSTVASFGVTGKAGLSYTITLPSSDVTITLSGGTETMTINNFTALPASSVAGDQLTGTLDGTGADSFTVGGRLNVTAAQAEGIYESTFAVSIAYN